VTDNCNLEDNLTVLKKTALSDANDRKGNLHAGASHLGHRASTEKLSYCA
jgi:hypothetical protein